MTDAECIKSIRLAVMHIYRGDHATAHLLITEILNHRPEHAFARCWLAYIFHKKGAYEKAKSLYESAILLRPGEIFFWYQLGMLHHEEGDHISAEYAFLKAAYLDEKHYDTARMLLRTYLYLGQLHPAKIAADRLALISNKSIEERAYIQLFRQFYAGHEATILNRKDYNIFVPITFIHQGWESTLFTGVYPEIFLFEHLGKFLNEHSNIIEVGGGCGLLASTMMQQYKAKVYAMDFRQRAMAAHRKIVAHPKIKQRGSIDLRYLDRLPADGTSRYEWAQKKDLYYSPTKSPNGSTASNTLDSMSFEAIDCIIHHWADSAAAFITGATGHLKAHKPLLVLRLKRHQIPCIEEQLAPIHYKLSYADYADDSIHLYTFFQAV